MTSAEGSIRLNALDHLPPANYSHSILYLSLSSGTSPKQAFEVLQQGLLRTFEQLPWLSGKVQPVSPDDTASLEIRYSSTEAFQYNEPYQLKYHELGDDVPYEELRESAFHPTAFPDESLTWAPFVPDVKNGTEVFVSQANFLPGACLLASAMCHVVGDGVAVNAVLKIWSENCERLQLGLAAETLPAELSNHDLLDQLYASEGSGRSECDISPDTWRLLGLAPPDQEASGAEARVSNGSDPPAKRSHKPELKACLFYISSENVTALRADCQHAANDSDLSFNDVICALIWRSLLRARVGARKAAGAVSAQVDIEEARLDLPFDVRAYFPEVMPPAYLGNFTMINQVLQPLALLTAPRLPSESLSSIASVAQAIRKAAGGVTKEKLLDAYQLVKSRTGGERSLTLDNLCVDGNGLIITSFVTFATDSVTFGAGTFGNGGRPDAMRSMMGAISKVFRYCAILPRKSSGGVEFIATVSDDEMELLEKDDEFNGYAMFVS